MNKEILEIYGARDEDKNIDGLKLLQVLLNALLGKHYKRG